MSNVPDGLAPGSIVQHSDSGQVFVMNPKRDWVQLVEALIPLPLPDGEMRVLHEVRKNVLDDYRANAIITYDRSGVAIRNFYGFWEVAGVSGEYTNEEMIDIYISDPSTVRSVGVSRD